MKCKVCGTFNEDYLEYCENCAALLIADEPSETAQVKETTTAAAPVVPVAEAAPAEKVRERTAEEIIESRKGWSFVTAPAWRKIDFDANTIVDEEIPENKPIFSAPVASLTEEDISSTVDETAQKLAAQKAIADRKAQLAAQNASTATTPLAKLLMSEPSIKAPELKHPEQKIEEPVKAPEVVVEAPKSTEPEKAKETPVFEETTIIEAPKTPEKPRPLSAVRKPLAEKKPEVVPEKAEEKPADTDFSETIIAKPITKSDIEAAEKKAEAEKQEKIASETKTAPVQAEKSVEVQPEATKSEDTEINNTIALEPHPSDVNSLIITPNKLEAEEDDSEVSDSKAKKTSSIGMFFANLFKRKNKLEDDEIEEGNDSLGNEIYDEYDIEEDKERKESLFKRFRMTFLVTGICLVLICLVVWLSLNVSSNFNDDWGRFFKYTFSNYPIRKPATTSTEMLDGEPARIITVYAKKGHTIRFMGEEYSTTSDEFKFRVVDRIWIPDEPIDSATIDVTPELTIIAPDGTETAVDFDAPITVAIPSLELNVTTPSVTDIPSASGFIDFVGSITDLSASVFINDKQVQVDEAGNFSARYSDLESGINILNVEARKNGYQIARKTFNVTNGAGSTATAPGTIALSFDLGEGRFRTTTDSITVSGNMEVGAVVAVSGVTTVGEVTQDAAAGTFTFQIHTGEVKVYSVNVTAAKDGVATTKTIYIERAPADKDTYMYETKALDYEALKSNPNSDETYAFRGTITEISQTDPYFKLKVKTESGDIIVCYYNNLFTAAEFAEDAEFKFYGDPHGADGDTPMIHAWYIKKYSN